MNTTAAAVIDILKLFQPNENDNDLEQVKEKKNSISAMISNRINKKKNQPVQAWDTKVKIINITSFFTLDISK